MRQGAAQGGFLLVVALVFGLAALRYPVGTLERPGPGLFPLAVSGALLCLSLALWAGKRGELRERLQLRGRNIGLLLLALLGFVAATRLVDMAAGVAVLVLTAGMAARRPSLKRGVLLTIALVAVALGFQHLLGLRLGVF